MGSYSIGDAIKLLMEKSGWKPHINELRMRQEWENIVGKTVLIEGTAVVKTETESMRRHYAEDSGKPKEEIEKIKGDLKDIQFSASGVKVLD